MKAKQIGKNVKLSRRGTFYHPENIIMGDNVFIGEKFHISAYKLTFGQDIIIGPNCVIECSNHKFDIVGRTTYKDSADKTYKAVTIEGDNWLGANVIVLPGVTISEGCIVGAGSVVSKTLPPYTICVGVPCKPIKHRFSKEDLQEHLRIKGNSHYTADEIFSKYDF